jgi:hypothetical protein
VHTLRKIKESNGPYYDVKVCPVEGVNVLVKEEVVDGVFIHHAKRE